jgi:hypothetical protein
MVPKHVTTGTPIPQMVVGLLALLSQVGNVQALQAQQIIATVFVEMENWKPPILSSVTMEVKLMEMGVPQPVSLRTLTSALDLKTPSLRVRSRVGTMSSTLLIMGSNATQEERQLGVLIAKSN